VKTVKKVLVAVTLILIIILTGCRNSRHQDSKRQVSSFERETVYVDLPVRLYIQNKYGNIKIYKWNNDSICFDITKKIIGSDNKDSLLKNMENIDYNIIQQEDRITFVSAINPKREISSEYRMDIELYIPQHIELLSLALTRGRVDIYDDLSCDLVIEHEEADISVNHFKGILKISGGKGNIEISGGKILGSDIDIDAGNIDIRSEFGKSMKHSIKTDTGNICLLLPEETYTEYSEEFSGHSLAFTSLSEYNFNVSTGMGEINIKCW